MDPETGPTKRLVVCVRNTGHATALKVQEIYQALADPEAERQGLLRVVDESGEDVLYPQRYFRSLDLPQSLQSALRRSVG